MHGVFLFAVDDFNLHHGQQCNLELIFVMQVCAASDHTGHIMILFFKVKNNNLLFVGFYLPFLCIFCTFKYSVCGPVLM